MGRAFLLFTIQVRYILTQEKEIKAKAKSNSYSILQAHKYLRRTSSALFVKSSFSPHVYVIDIAFLPY
jgi:hypothetical protein